MAGFRIGSHRVEFSTTEVCEAFLRECGAVELQTPGKGAMNDVRDMENHARRGRQVEPCSVTAGLKTEASPILSELMGQRKLLQELQATVENLELRLGPVLRRVLGDGCDEASGECTPDDVRSSVVRMIEENSAEITLVTRRIAEIRGRLEV